MLHLYTHHTAITDHHGLSLRPSPLCTGAPRLEHRRPFDADQTVQPRALFRFPTSPPIPAATTGDRLTRVLLPEVVEEGKKKKIKKRPKVRTSPIIMATITTTPAAAAAAAAAVTVASAATAATSPSLPLS